MENDILTIDVNEIVSNQIKEKFSNLENQIIELNNTIENKNSKLKELSLKLKELETKNNNNEYVSFLFDKLKNTFSQISNDPEKAEFKKLKNQKQFEFIDLILITFFDIKKEQNGWLSYDTSSSTLLERYLAINYYENKDIVINLLKILDDKCKDKIDFIKNFRMPCDYSKEEVLNYVKNPHYCTNGNIFQISQYWVESGLGKENLPHHLIMKNKFILEEDVFDELIKTIKSERLKFYYLFSLPKYNKNITKEQIQKMGSCLSTIYKYLNYKEIQEFIKDNLLDFNEETLNYLYLYITTDNQFKIFHWENFPVKYQISYLMNKPINDVFKLFNNSSCKWTEEQKEEFLRLRYKGN